MILVALVPKPILNVKFLGCRCLLRAGWPPPPKAMPGFREKIFFLSFNFFLSLGIFVLLFLFGPIIVFEVLIGCYIRFFVTFTYSSGATAELGVSPSVGFH